MRRVMVGVVVMMALAIGAASLWGLAEPPGDRLGRFVLVSAAAIVVVSGGGLLWRRQRGGSAKWIRVAATSAMFGTVLGYVVSRAAADSALPAAVVTTVVTSVAMAVAWVALIRPLTSGNARTVGAGR